LLTIPIDLIQPPVYNSEWPLSHTYGVLSTILSSEIAFSLESDANEFGSFGQKENIFDNETIDLINAYGKCINRQYAMENISMAEDLAKHSGN
jgi:hypothetical protein